MRRPRRFYCGIFRSKGGSGVVRVDGAVPPNGSDQLFIPASCTLDAAPGDRVRVELLPDEEPSWIRHLPRRQRAAAVRLCAEVIEVLQRAKYRFVGTFHCDRRRAWVDIDGGIFQKPVLITDGLNASEGQKAVVEMKRFPSPFHRGEGKIAEVLGRFGERGVDRAVIERQFELPCGFDAEVLREAREAARAFEPIAAGDPKKTAEPLRGRTDLTGELVITIDPEDARDFDDAVSLGRDADGGWHLGVHIADVSHFVRTGSAIDLQARRRGTSVYLPDAVIPMLPEELCNHLASLQPGATRLTKTVLIDYSPSGEPLGARIFRSYIRSGCRLSYETADAFLAADGPLGGGIPPEVGKLLRRMNRLAETLRRQRRQRGAIELNFPDIKIVTGPGGRVAAIRSEPMTPARRMIEEFMLAANREAARFLQRHRVPFLRRIHPEPSPSRVEALADYLAAFGPAFALKPPKAREKGPGESLSIRAALGTLVERARGTDREEAIEMAVLRSMPKAVYSPENQGHFALALDCYTHFTSPIRRYPDLTIHRLIDAVLDGQTASIPTCGELVELGEEMSAKEREAQEAEREGKKLKMIEFLSRRIGRTMRGVVTGVERFGVFVRGTKIPVEGMIPLRCFDGGRYRFDPQLKILTGLKKGNIIRPGDRMTVTVTLADFDTRQIGFAPALARGSRK
ncbi:MAG: VacB/RNase II family 3'-5' exoribonuclease [Thermoguttaceae bacterium]|nr:VacB/RNase II family 3'-5' exoribonuclease [Thermoguttaceae bacterium]